MRRLLLVAAISALAWARPETYKETEDFQYARSSSDEGSKSGFYGAQRGNVGGNYERAHNMDSLAQHQMSGAVHQVEGELGDASKTRTGSVFTAANSRGVYGSGRYDLSNLQGRNFGESGSSDSSHSSLSSAYNQHSQNSDWRSHAQHSTGYAAADQYGQSSLHSGSLQAADSASSINNHRLSNSDNQYGHSSGYHSQSGYNSQTRYQGESDSAYNQRLLSSHLSNGYVAQAGDQTQSRYVVTPVRIYGRPGTQVAIPVFAQGYTAHGASGFDQNAINSEAEVLNNNQQHISAVPQGNAKHYESSYNYRKAWERRSESNPSDVVTASVAPTVNPYPTNSELYDEGQVASGSNSLQQANSHGFSSSAGYNAQSSMAQSGSSQSRHQSDYSSQHKSQSGLNSNAYTVGTHGSLTGASLGTNVDSQPKSYQSSYSYHKSWERQGDPYVIVPETNGASIAANTKTGASSLQHHSSQYRQSNQHHSQGSAYDCDCDEYGNVRAKRSYNDFQYQEDLGQQAQTGWEENLGKQEQQSWGNFQQQTQTVQQEDLGQQTQDSWGDLQQQSKPEKLEDLGQHSQNWHELGQQVENQLGQQTQQARDQSERHVNSQNLEEFGHHDNQQSQHTFDDLENLGQQTQSKWDNLDTLGHQTQHAWDKSVNVEQQNKPESIEDLRQQTQKKWDDIENLGQQIQTQLDDSNNINKKPHLDTINTEQITQTQFVSGNENKQDKEQTADSWNTQHITGHTDSVRNNENSYFNNPMHPALWGATSNNRHETSFYNQQHNNNNFNSYSQSHGVNRQEQVNLNKLQTSSHNPLQNLWDKIKDLEEQTILSSNDRQQSSETFTGYENSQHSYNTQESIYHHEGNSEQASNSYHHNQYQTHYTGLPTVTPTGSTSDQFKNEKDTTIGASEKPNNKETANKFKPTDVGRGDIDDEEDNPPEINTPQKEDDSQIYSTHIKPEKTPEEIEALSLSRGTDGNESKSSSQIDELSVLSIGQQQWLEDQRQQVSNDLQKLSSTSTTKKPFINENSRNKPELSIYEHNFEQHSVNSQDLASSHYYSHKHNQDVETESQHIFEKPEELQPEHQFKDLDQQILNENPTHSGRTGSQQENKHSYEYEDFGQRQNAGQEPEDFGQQTQDLNQQNLESFGNFEHHNENTDQQNTGQELEDFGQQSQDLNQQNLQQFESLQHQNQHSSQQLEDLGQQNQDLNLNQENLQQFENSEHQNQHSSQQLEDFGQQTQNLNQHDLESFGNLEQHSQNQNTDQQNTDQQLEDFGQQTQNLNQHDLESFGNLEQHSQNQNTDQQNTGQQLEDFGQQTQDLNQQNLQQFENFGQHNQNQSTGQQLEDFGQQSQDLDQYTYLNLGHHNQNIEQQNTGQQLQDFGQQSEDMNQQSLQQFENIGQQSQNMDQQKAWEQIDDLKPLHENPNSFGKYNHQSREYDPNTREIQEPIVTKIETKESQSVPKKEVEAPPQEPTEKPGFWKSVGSKFSSAKDSVASWFSRS